MGIIPRAAVQSAHELDIISHSPAQTERFGQRIGELLRAGDLLLLGGTFGVGKTHLAKGIARGLGSEDLVTSPTFVLINEYRSGERFAHMPIYHADLYRLAEGGELDSIGLEEIWQGDGVCLIEWAERAAGQLPVEHLAITLQHLSETKRTLRFMPHGTRYRELVEQFKQQNFK